MLNLDVDWNLVGNHLLLMSVAYLLALPIGWERERATHSAGLRTFSLVAVSACAYILISLSVFPGEDAQSRAVQGLLTGIGFIGGGVILKNSTSVKGLATAAAIWSTGAIGMAVAYRRLEVAIVLSVLTFITLHYLTRFKPGQHD
ncbi:MAG: MgtC/SapB family protein [Gammaproteobacteria bacterium]|nr:MgtC/SapB family protein [Gammaproteobacteria bacterium]